METDINPVLSMLKGNCSRVMFVGSLEISKCSLEFSPSSGSDTLRERTGVPPGALSMTLPMYSVSRNRGALSFSSTTVTSTRAVPVLPPPSLATTMNWKLDVSSRSMPAPPLTTPD